VAAMNRTLPVLLILDRLGHEERLLRNLGAHEQANGIRAAIVQILKLADEPDTEAPKSI
jgi:hypothetical protein